MSPLSKLLIVALVFTLPMFTLRLAEVGAAAVLPWWVVFLPLELWVVLVGVVWVGMRIESRSL